MTQRLLLLFALGLAVGLPQAFAQKHVEKGSGKPYGARDPQTCASRKEPAKGAPSAAQAAQYFACDQEGVDGFRNLTQVADVKVEVAPKGRPFNVLTDSVPDIDVSALVFNIRGGFTQNYCTLVGGNGQYSNAGKNCLVYDEPNAKGTCYKDNFGDWHCQMVDGAGLGRPRQGGSPVK